jgi:hypothetical protein
MAGQVGVRRSPSHLPFITFSRAVDAHNDLTMKGCMGGAMQYAGESQAHQKAGSNRRIQPLLRPSKFNVEGDDQDTSLVEGIQRRAVSKDCVEPGRTLLQRPSLHRLDLRIPQEQVVWQFAEVE